MADFFEELRGFIKSELIDLNTSIEGTIVSYSAGMATVRPAGKKRYADGDALDYPVITDVPVRWPTFAGGNAGVKGPVQSGDKCILVFSQQAIDGSDDLRRHDLNDCYAVMVDGSTQSQGGNNEDMVMYFGAAFIKLTSDGKLEINAPAGTETVAPSNLFTGSITGQKGMNITGSHPDTGRASTFTGTIKVESGDVIADSISLKSHGHTEQGDGKRTSNSVV